MARYIGFFHTVWVNLPLDLPQDTKRRSDRVATKDAWKLQFSHQAKAGAHTYGFFFISCIRSFHISLDLLYCRYQSEHFGKIYGYRLACEHYQYEETKLVWDRYFKPICYLIQDNILKFDSWCSHEACVLRKISIRSFAKSRLFCKKRWHAAHKIKMPQLGHEITQERPKTTFEQKHKISYSEQ